MFVRMLLRAAALRRGRAASALLAMIVAAAVATAMMNLYVDVQAKLRTRVPQLRRQCGHRRRKEACTATRPSDVGSSASNALEVESALGARTLAVPFAYAVARTKDGQSVVVVGTDFARARQLNHWWNVSHWPDAQMDALVGMRADMPPSRPSSASRCRGGQPNRQPFDLTFQGQTIHLAPAGLLQTGAGEDSRIYLDQTEFQNWTGRRTHDHRSRRQRNSSDEIQQR